MHMAWMCLIMCLIMCLVRLVSAVRAPGGPGPLVWSIIRGRFSAASWSDNDFLYKVFPRGVPVEHPRFFNVELRRVSQDIALTRSPRRAWLGLCWAVVPLAEALKVTDSSTGAARCLECMCSSSWPCSGTDPPGIPWPRAAVAGSSRSVKGGMCVCLAAKQPGRSEQSSPRGLSPGVRPRPGFSPRRLQTPPGGISPAPQLLEHRVGKVRVIVHNHRFSQFSSSFHAYISLSYNPGIFCQRATAFFTCPSVTDASPWYYTFSSPASSLAATEAAVARPRRLSCWRLPLALEL